ncbi:MAG: hypothetical protein ACKVTZ_17280 [Bacteroidia bacterium]
MAFSDKKYKELGDVLKAYSLVYTNMHGFQTAQPFAVSAQFAQEIQFVLDNVVYKTSEEAICENLLYPILKEVWKPYITYFSLWSHKALTYDDQLKGTPDYLISKRSALGYIVFEHPYVAVVEAKLDDFIGGWAQCALEMLAMQKMNHQPELPIFGIVSNGDFWEFGKLEGQHFTQYKEKGKIEALSELMAMLTFLLEECKRVYI